MAGVHSSTEELLLKSTQEQHLLEAVSDNAFQARGDFRSRIENLLREQAKKLVYDFLTQLKQDPEAKEILQPLFEDLSAIEEFGWKCILDEQLLQKSHLEQLIATQEAKAVVDEENPKTYISQNGVSNLVEIDRAAIFQLLAADSLYDRIRVYGSESSIIFRGENWESTASNKVETSDQPINPTTDIKVFKNLLKDTDIVDSSYPLSALVWLPYGTKILEHFNSHFRSLLHQCGFEECIFPSLVPASEFDRINREIYPFDNVIYRPSASTVLRPSGEAAFYPMFRKWIRTKDDLPLKVFQIASMFRNVRAAGIFKPNESNHFVEGHTAHATREEAMAQLQQNNEINSKLLDYMAVPAIQSYRPSFTNRPVAEVHVGFDTLLPSGETVLTACAYGQMQIFSKVFDISYSDKGNRDFTYQTELGFSQKIALASMWLTSDEKGLCLLPEISPTQVVIMVLSDDIGICDRAEKIASILRNLGIRAEIDVHKKNLHKRHEKFEKQGIPLRIEFGKNEFTEDSLTIIRRDDSSRMKVNIEESGSVVDTLLKDISRSLRKRTDAYHKQHLCDASDYSEASRVVREGSVAMIDLCKNETCVFGAGKAIGAGEVLGFSDERHGHCICCQSPTLSVAYYARRI